MAPKVRLYSLPISHYCVSADRMLAYKGVRFETRYAPYHDRQELLRVSGQDYVPALAWGRTIVPWKEIPEFLDRVVPEPPILPPGAAGLARTLENWGHQVLEEKAWQASVTKLLPRLRDARERWVFEEMQTRARGPWHVLEARRPEFARQLAPYLGLIDEMLEGREWILDRPTVADFGIYGGLSPWLAAGEAIPKELSNLGRWVRRIRAL